MAPAKQNPNQHEESNLFTVGVSVKATDAEEAVRFVSDMLVADVRWDDPLSVEGIAEGAVFLHAPVHVLTYEYRHGSTTLVYAGEEKARKALATIARQFWDEARECDDTLPMCPPEDDAMATRLYFEAQEDSEGYSIAETALDIRLSVDREQGTPAE